jgi:peptidyl-tRNA hydrolase
LKNLKHGSNEGPNERKKKIMNSETPKESNFPILYIIMRDDLYSMNPGKRIAQGSHAANAAVKKAREYEPELLKEWENQTSDGFGTVLTLQAKNMDAIKDLIERVYAIINIASTSKQSGVAGIVHDPSYPIRDGSITHHIPLDTCAYVLCNEGSKIHALMKSVSNDFPLHK